MEEEHQISSEPRAATETPHWMPFVEWLAKNTDALEFEKSYRLMSRGLFVIRESSAKLIEDFKKWQAAEGRPIERSEEKVRRKLLGGEDPPELILREGKNTHWGYLIECRLPNPQNYRRAFHLGTPDFAGDDLRASDPIFGQLQNIKLDESAREKELVFKLPKGDLRLPFHKFKLFQSLALGSKNIMELFPRTEKNLAEALRALDYVIRKLHKVGAHDEPLRPRLLLRLKERADCRTAEGFYLYFDRSGRLEFMFHYYGRNFADFLQHEIKSLRRDRDWQRPLAFELAHERSRDFAQLSVGGQRMTVLWAAFSSFIKELVDNPHLIEKQPSPRSVPWYLSKFDAVCTRLEKIERVKVSAYLSDRYKHGYWFLVNEVWLCVISKKGVMVDCIARTAKHRR